MSPSLVLRALVLRWALLCVVMFEGGKFVWAATFIETEAAASAPTSVGSSGGGMSTGDFSKKSEVQDMSADALVLSARLALSLIDAGEFSRLWRLSARDTKSRLPLPVFITQMKEARESVGLISTRQWAGIARMRYAMSPVKDAVTPGLYANVEFASRQLDGGAVFEIVTLRIEDDGSLKFVGYMPRFKALDVTAQVSDAK